MPGWRWSAETALPMRFAVVSCAAARSSRVIRTASSASSPLSSAESLDSADSRSGPGWPRRSATRPGGALGNDLGYGYEGMASVGVGEQLLVGGLDAVVQLLGDAFGDLLGPGTGSSRRQPGRRAAALRVPARSRQPPSGAGRTRRRSSRPVPPVPRAGRRRRVRGPWAGRLPGDGPSPPERWHGSPRERPCRMARRTGSGLPSSARPWSGRAAPRTAPRGGRRPRVHAGGRAAEGRRSRRRQAPAQPGAPSRPGCRPAPREDDQPPSASSVDR